MANNNKVYQLKANDSLFGEKGKRITGEVYDLLPQVSKDKFEPMYKFKASFNAGTILTHSFNEAIELEVDEVYEHYEDDEYDENESNF